MKKSIILLSSLISMMIWGQEHYCGFEEKQAQLYKAYPNLKSEKERQEKELLKKWKSEKLKENKVLLKSQKTELRTLSTYSKYQGPIYEIPVVVHIIESTNPLDISPTDEQIEAWIDSTNKIFATTYGNGYYSEGNGLGYGTVMPFKLVLAKRTIDNQPTNGIKRYNGDGLSGYKINGMKDKTKGASEADIRKLAPHWSENYYYNIYLVTAFDGGRTGNGLLGYAYTPTNPNNQYDAFLKYYNVTKLNDGLLAHEIGHSLGLDHPFNGTIDSNGCPTGTNDNVDDTEIIRNMIGKSVPTNDEINICTNTNYQDGQYNVMNYTYSRRKFTEGQRDRALSLFLGNRKILTQSLGGKEPTTCTGNELGVKPLVTNIIKSSAYGANYQFGLNRVKFGDIDNPHPSLQIAYNDYTTSCMSTGYKTTIKEGESVTIEVTPSHNNQSIGVWIDYNDNGKFENNERVFLKENVSKTAYSYTFTPPTSAVKEKYLRMRVIGDYVGWLYVDEVNYGESEDYAVRIVPQNWQDPDLVDNSTDGRVGINTEEPKATLDISATKFLPETTPQGVIFPTFTTADRDTFQNVPEGTMIYNSDKKCLEIYTNGAWKCL